MAKAKETNPTAPAEEQDVPEYLGSTQVAKAMHVSPKTINRWANEGRIPCLVTFGGHRRFLRSDVEAAVAQMTPKPKAPPAE